MTKLKPRLDLNPHRSLFEPQVFVTHHRDAFDRPLVVESLQKHVGNES